MKALKKLFKKNEDGATAIEYGLIAALISVVIILAISYVGTQLSSTFHTVGDKLSSANTTAGTGGL